MTKLVAEQHDELRPLMFSIAYRMLGSVTEAEDIVQEAFLRMHRSDNVPDSPEAMATTVTTRLAIDHLRSARVRREHYIGPWLPEPWLTTDADADPAGRAERADTVSMAFMMLLERLTPVERAVLILRDVFAYEFAEIATVIGKSVANCRQILSRARKRVADDRPRFEPSADRRDDLARRFWAATQEGDVHGLEQLLADDVVFYGDGGGKAPAVTSPVVGGSQVARFVAGIFRQINARDGRVEPTWVNGQPGAKVVSADGEIATVLELTIGEGKILQVRNVLNPDKLRHLGPLFDWSAF